MMKVRINGKEEVIPSSMTISELVKKLTLTDRPIAVERNKEVIPKSKFDEIRLQEGDRIEIVHFVGGG